MNDDKLRDIEATLNEWERGVELSDMAEAVAVSQEDGDE